MKTASRSEREMTWHEDMTEETRDVTELESHVTGTATI